MSGRADFVPMTGQTLHYLEEGTVRARDGREMRFARRYIYSVEQYAIAVFFDEVPPRLFQHIPLTLLAGRLAGDGEHLCGMDRYQSKYLFDLAKHNILIRHVVQGPRKDYVLETHYR